MGEFSDVLGRLGVPTVMWQTWRPDDDHFVNRDALSAGVSHDPRVVMLASSKCICQDSPLFSPLQCLEASGYGVKDDNDSNGWHEHGIHYNTLMVRIVPDLCKESRHALISLKPTKVVSINVIIYFWPWSGRENGQCSGRTYGSLHLRSGKALTNFGRRTTRYLFRNSTSTSGCWRTVICWSHELRNPCLHRWLRYLTVDLMLHELCRWPFSKGSFGE